MNKSKVREQNTDEGIRLNKYLSDAGFCSRREADRLIEAGRVTINGRPTQMGQKVLPGDVVKCGRETIESNEKMVLLAFNKPEGIECTTDRGNPDNIIDYIHYPERIYPIGRLDKNSCGLILLTNTGSLVNDINRAANHHEKEYIVRVDKPITKDFLEKMANGVPILDTVTRKCRINATGKCTFNIILTQGLNRQIRRMCEALGYKVVFLKRVRIMNINLGNLPEGHYRNVTEAEVNKLMKDLKNAENK
ncbi:MAG: pseudouridine synthase [Lachnospiraceae bacterium]|nr:pseudouridine synthase [Lachnospiraceae bacterium]